VGREPLFHWRWFELRRLYRSLLSGNDAPVCLPTGAKYWLSQVLSEFNSDNERIGWEREVKGNV